jgi:outer membrane protein assembly factor BamB
MIIQKTYKEYQISIFNDPFYDPNSVDNSQQYTHVFSDKKRDDYFGSAKHGVKIFEGDKLVKSALLIGSGGGTGIHETCSLIDDNKLLVCCGDSVFCLALPNLNLEWRTEADTATCFEIFQYKSNYLIHGELEITCLDKAGRVNWKFSGSDIFTTPTGKDTFKIVDGMVYATNWDNVTFQLDANTGAVIK